MLFLRRDRKTGPGEVVVTRPDGSHARVLAKLKPCFGEPQLSPDGTTLALASGCKRDGAVWLLSLHSKQLRRIGIVSSHAESSAAPAWSPDGTGIAFVAGSRLIEVVDTRGVVRSKIIGDDIILSGPRWSRDGSQLLFAEPTSAVAQGCQVHGGSITNLFAVPADGSARPQTVRQSCRDEFDADWITTS